MNSEQATITKEQVMQAVRERIEAAAQIETIEAQKRIEVSDVEERHAGKLQDAKDIVSVCDKIIEEYVNDNRHNILADGAKSTKLGASTVGFRLTPAKPVLLEGYEMDKVIRKLKTRHPELVVTKTTEKLDPKKVVAFVQVTSGDLKRFGIDVVQEEKFFIK